MALSLTLLTTAQNKVASSTWVIGSVSTPQVDYVLVAIAADNPSNTSGISTFHTSLQDAGGRAFTKIAEYTRGGGAALNGVTVSLWWRKYNGETPGNITAAFSSSTVAAKAAVIFRLRSSSTIQVGASLAEEAGGGTATAASDAHNSGTGSSVTASLSGLSNPSLQRSYIVVSGKEGSARASATPTGYTLLGGNNTTGGSSDATNIAIDVWHRIVTSGTSESVTVSYGNDTTMDKLVLIVAIDESRPPIAGSNRWLDSGLPGHAFGLNSASVGTASTAQTGVSGQGLASLGLIANSIGSVALAGVGQLNLGLRAQGLGTLVVTGLGSSSLELRGQGYGVPAIAGLAGVPLSLAGSAVGLSTVGGIGLLSLGLAGGGYGASSIAGWGAPYLVLFPQSLGGVEVRGLGASTLALSPQGLGGASLQGSGLAGLEVRVAGYGSQVSTAIGSVSLGLGASATGGLLVSGQGQAPVTLLLQGVGTPQLQGLGSVSIQLVPGGVGGVSLVGSGSSSLSLSVGGSGTPIVVGPGSSPVSLHGGGTAILQVVGSGAIPLSLSPSGVGASLVAGVGSTPLSLTPAGRGEVLLSSIGLASLSLAARGVGEASVEGSGQMLLVANTLGTGASLINGIASAGLGLLGSGTGSLPLQGGEALIPLGLSGFGVGASVVVGTGLLPLGLAPAGAGVAPIGGVSSSGLALSLSGYGEAIAQGRGVIGAGLSARGIGEARLLSHPSSWTTYLGGRGYGEVSGELQEGHMQLSLLSQALGHLLVGGDGRLNLMVAFGSLGEIYVDGSAVGLLAVTPLGAGEAAIEGWGDVGFRTGVAGEIYGPGVGEATLATYPWGSGLVWRMSPPRGAAPVLWHVHNAHVAYQPPSIGGSGYWEHRTEATDLPIFRVAPGLVGVRAIMEGSEVLA